MSGIYKIIKIVFIISMSPGQWTAVMHFPVWNETFFVRFDLNNIGRVEKKKSCNTVPTNVQPVLLDSPYQI